MPVVGILKEAGWKQIWILEADGGVRIVERWEVLRQDQPWYQLVKSMLNGWVGHYIE